LSLLWISQRKEEYKYPLLGKQYSNAEINRNWREHNVLLGRFNYSTKSKPFMIIEKLKNIWKSMEKNYLWNCL